MGRAQTWGTREIPVSPDVMLFGCQGAIVLGALTAFRGALVG